MTNPIDVIASALYRADSHHTSDTAHHVAKVAADALIHDDIVSNAVRSLLDDGWRHAHEGPQGQSELFDQDLADIARTVLRSVGGE